eukprot:GHUV01020399.1.p2 GENE.GHUV01020399.1~~GHUV01020399.1.p2  ORF type:complete len:105 (+),score=15.58 GHUV01020399.1:274-588(+)
MASVQGGGSAAPAKPDAAWVAQEFVKRYYEVLAKHPKYLNRFYKEESQFTLTIRNHGVPETRQTVSTTQVSPQCLDICYIVCFRHRSQPVMASAAGTAGNPGQS